MEDAIPTEGMKLGNPDEPSTPYEIELFASMARAQAVLGPIYDGMLHRDFAVTEAKSRGLLLAINRLLAIHLVQHGVSMGLPIEKVLTQEKASLVANIDLVINELYQEALEDALSAEAAENTKQ